MPIINLRRNTRSEGTSAWPGGNGIGIGIYNVDYLLPFHFRSEEARPNYLLLSCNRGGSTYSGEGAEALCIPGEVMPISSTGNSTCMTGPQGFGHLSVILDAKKVNDFAAQWIGRPLSEPLRFGLEPLSPDIATQWNLAAGCLRQMMHMAPAPVAAADSLLEHMLKLLVTGHVNNQSSMLDPDHCAHEQLARTAILMIESDPMRWRTLSGVAHAMGCGTSALENGIRRYAGKGSAEIIYEARLNGVSRALAKAGGQHFAAVLTAYGFSASGRFAWDYCRRFGSRPPPRTGRIRMQPMGPAHRRPPAMRYVSRRSTVSSRRHRANPLALPISRGSWAKASIRRLLRSGNSFRARRCNTLSRDGLSAQDGCFFIRPTAFSRSHSNAGSIRKVISQRP